MSAPRDELLAPEIFLLQPVLEADGARWGANWQVSQFVLELDFDQHHIRIETNEGNVSLEIDAKWAISHLEPAGAWVPEWRWWAVLAHFAATSPREVTNEGLLLTPPFGDILIAAVDKREKWRAARARRKLLKATMDAALRGEALPAVDTVKQALAQFPSWTDAFNFLFRAYLNASASEWGAAWESDGETLRLVHSDYPNVDVRFSRVGPEVYSLVRDGRWRHYEFMYEWPNQAFADDLNQTARMMMRVDGEISGDKLVLRDGSEVLKLYEWATKRPVGGDLH